MYGIAQSNEAWGNSLEATPKNKIARQQSIMTANSKKFCLPVIPYFDSKNFIVESRNQISDSRLHVESKVQLESFHISRHTQQSYNDMNMMEQIKFEYMNLEPNCPEVD
jgi:hypothetical protein